MKRNLTAGEIALAQVMFQQAIDYAAVSLVFDSWWQKRSKTALAPNGNVYFPAHARCEDFSVAAPHMQVWFMHEMTHVWQYQRGFSVLKSGVVLTCVGGYRHARAYQYLQAACSQIKPFHLLNMEQQAEVVAHYFAAKHLRFKQYQSRLPLLEQCLQPFLAHPTWLGLLPNYSRCG